MIEKEPLVSIIIPNYNSSNFIIETLESVINQSYFNWECIIIDDHSTDNSVQIIKKFIENKPKFKFFSRPEYKPKGANSCRNYGLEKSEGSFVNWFDSDDVMLSNFLEVKVKYILKHDFIITTGCFASHDLNPDKNKKIDLFDSSFLYKDYVSWKLKVLTPSVLFKKEFLLANQYAFNERLSKSQEMELFSKIFYKSKPEQFKIINEVTYLYRSHEHSTTSKNQVYNKVYKESETISLIANFKRSLLLRDDELIQRFNRLLINMLKRGVDNGHLENVNIIINVFYETILPKNKIRLILLKNLTKFFLVSKIKFIRWELPFKKIKINY